MIFKRKIHENDGGPTNVVGGGAIAGTGGKGGEPGVYLPRKKNKTPVMAGLFRRKQTNE